jgi:hypothetical protein
VRHSAAFLMLTACVILPSPCSAGEPLASLVQDGYLMIYRSPYAVVETCTPDHPVTVDSYIFVCTGYEYTYRYGAVFLMGRSQGQGGSDVFLCTGDGDQGCFEGTLYKR